jgi:hypothetical protein
MKDPCYVDRCDAAAVGVAAYHSTSERDVVLVWLCAEHGATFTPPADATTDLLVQAEARKAPCGGYATHIVVVGQEYSDDRAPKIRAANAMPERLRRICCRRTRRRVLDGGAAAAGTDARPLRARSRTAAGGHHQLGAAAGRRRDLAWTQGTEDTRQELMRRQVGRGNSL